MEKKKLLLNAIIQTLLIMTIIVCSKKQSKDNIQYVSFDDSTVVAIINNESIFFDDIDNAAKQMIIQTGMVNKIDYRDSVIQSQALDWLVANTLLRQEAKKYTIEVKDEEVDKAIEQIKSNFPSEEKFNEALQEENLMMYQFRDNIILDLKVQKLVEQQVMTKVPETTTEKARGYYQQNPSKFEKPLQAHARHILVRVDQGVGQAEVEKARKKIQSISDKIKQGQDFAEVAKSYSEGPSASRGGDLGYFSRGDMVKSFDEAVFSLKPGEISDIVRTEFGFHIIKLEDFKKSSMLPFEQVENSIKEYLKQMESKQLFDKYIDELKQKSKIQLRKKEE